MDLVAGMLRANLESAAGGRARGRMLVHPKYVRLFDRVPVATLKRSAQNLDRLVNRLICYPLWLIRNRKNFNIFTWSITVTVSSSINFPLSALS